MGKCKGKGKRKRKMKQSKILLLSKLACADTGRWAYIPQTMGLDKHNARTILCKCECGTEKPVRIRTLLSGQSKTCVKCMRITHGDSYSKLYKAYQSMHTRCYNNKHLHYARYGGSGIKICQEWHEYVKFKNWAINNGYKEGLQIDRIDTYGDYSPSNCRYVTPKQNARNRKDSHLLTAFGETKPVCVWAEDPRCVVKGTTLRERLRRGEDAERAISSGLRRSV